LRNRDANYKKRAQIEWLTTKQSDKRDISKRWSHGSTVNDLDL